MFFLFFVGVPSPHRRYQRFCKPFGLAKGKTQDPSARFGKHQGLWSPKGAAFLVTEKSLVSIGPPARSVRCLGGSHI